MRSHRELIVWQKSVEFVKEIYLITKLFPKDEQYALTNQLRRAVVSIPSNIAEGQRRRSAKEFLQFAQISFGSAAECDTQIEIAYQLGYIKKLQNEELIDKLNSICRMLNRLTFKLNTTN